VNRTGSWKYIRPVFEDKVAPCNQGCPVGIDLESVMTLVRAGRLEAARELVLRENPLPAVTGRVCYHPCENACNRASIDDAVAIHAVERMLGDLALEDPLPARPVALAETVGIVGSGPAGLACASHLARFGYRVTIYEADEEPGGVLRYGIPEYRLPRRVLSGEIARIRALGVRIRCGVKVGREVTFGEIGHHDAIFLATGVHRSRPLGIPGEDLPGVRRGLDLLKEVNRGGTPRLGRRVVVVGGGNTAMDCARTAARLGAEVTVLYRRGRAEMPAHSEEVEQALHEGVAFGFLAAPTAVRGAERVPEQDGIEAVESSFGEFDGRASGPRTVGLECVRMQLGAPDASGRRRPEPVAGSDFFVPADTVLTALGEEAELDFLPEDVRREHGTIRVHPLGGTSRAAVFAGGDLIDEPHTVAFAIGSGKRAAIGIDRFLRLRSGEIADALDLGELRLGPEGNLSMTRWRDDDPIARVNPARQVVTPEHIQPAHYASVPRAADRLRPPELRRHDFDEANLGIPFEAALGEAGRCLQCGVCTRCEVCLIFCPDIAISRLPDGRLEIDYDYCKGCGVCAAECPRGAITMTREGL